MAKPYWSNDEVDLVVIVESGGLVAALPVQVKSVQRPAGRRAGYTQGLRKSHLTKAEYLSLAVYEPDTDKMWLMVGCEAIRKAHARKAIGRKPFDQLPPGADLRIRVDEVALAEWAIPPNDPDWIASQFRALAARVVKEGPADLLADFWGPSRFLS